MTKDHIFVGSDVTSDGVSIVVRNGAEIIHAEFYAVPPRKSLTDEQISDLWCKVSNTDFVTADTHVFVRAIEKAHGIV